ncbi:MAG: hypothetical protein ABSB11_10810 [Sedimentisphaerales bacterium]|jgi:hypothetical protein
MAGSPKKSLGNCIDEILKALQGVDDASRVIAMKAVCDHLNISIGIPSPLSSGEVGQKENTTEVKQQKDGVLDLRTLKEQKEPGSAIEMACIVAYYLENHAPGDERKMDITAKDITRYFKQGGYTLPKSDTQLLVDAKKAGYMDSKKRGQYSLNPVGYNLVAHSLPRKPKKE